jgi:PhnB protein
MGRGEAVPANPPDDMPRIAPNLFYDDPAAALDWLARTFGFEVRMSLPGPDGGLMHAEMQVADSVIMMSPTSSTEQWRSPQSLDGSVTQSLYVYVDHVDASSSHSGSPISPAWADPRL